MAIHAGKPGIEQFDVGFDLGLSFSRYAFKRASANGHEIRTGGSAHHVRGNLWGRHDDDHGRDYVWVKDVDAPYM